MNKKKIFMIISICILVITIIGTTVAYYTLEAFTLNTDTITHGLDYYINYEKGQNITGSLEPSSTYEGGKSATIELWKDAESPYDIYGHIYLNTDEVGYNMYNLAALKYALVKDGSVVSSGTVVPRSDNKILLKANIPLTTEETLYTVYLWLDETKANSTISGETISLSVSCEATMKPIEIPEKATTLISNLYLDNVSSQKEALSLLSGKYYYAQSTRLANDNYNSTSATEIRNILYFCDSTSEKSCDRVNNYIYFNCDNYSDTLTCETWRILGLIDGKIKIVRQGSIGNYSYDYNADKTSTNPWWSSSLMKLLNDGYYYNKDEVPYYNRNTTPITINFKEDGIGITDATRLNNLIANATWYNINYLTNISHFDYQSLYNQERGGSITWDGKIAIMSATESIINWWMTGDFWGGNTNVPVRIINKYRDHTNNLALNLHLSSYTFASTYGTAYPTQIIPTLYLSENVRIKDGDGSSGNPYQIDA